DVRPPQQPSRRSIRPSPARSRAPALVEPKVKALQQGERRGTAWPIRLEATPPATCLFVRSTATDSSRRLPQFVAAATARADQGQARREWPKQWARTLAAQLASARPTQVQRTSVPHWPLRALGRRRTAWS